MLKTVSSNRVMFVLALILCVGPAWAQEEGGVETQTAAVDPGSYEEQLDRFFASVLGGEAGKAVDDLYAFNTWNEKITEQVTSLKAQFEALPEVVGKPHDHELVTEKFLTDRFVYRWYVVSYDRQPLSFHFTFYKPQDTWMVYSFEYKDDVKGLLEEEARRQALAGEGSGGS